MHCLRFCTRSSDKSNTKDFKKVKDEIDRVGERERYDKSK